MQREEMQTTCIELESMKGRFEEDERRLGCGRSHESPLSIMLNHSLSLFWVTGGCG